MSHAAIGAIKCGGYDFRGAQQPFIIAVISGIRIPPVASMVTDRLHRSVR